MRSRSSKTFSCVVHSFDSSKCFTSSAIRAASSSTSACVGISLDHLRYGRAVSCQFPREAKDLRKQFLNARTQMHSESGVNRLHSDDEYLRGESFKLLQNDEEIFPIDHARRTFDHTCLNLFRIRQDRRPAMPAHGWSCRAEVGRCNQNHAFVTRVSLNKIMDDGNGAVTQVVHLDIVRPLLLLELRDCDRPN